MFSQVTSMFFDAYVLETVEALIKIFEKLFLQDLLFKHFLKVKFYFGFILGMAFRSLVPIFSRGFSRSRMNVILVKVLSLLFLHLILPLGLPPCRFRRPNCQRKARVWSYYKNIAHHFSSYAERYLIPNNIAVYNFPGTHERLFPDWDV